MRTPTYPTRFNPAALIHITAAITLLGITPLSSAQSGTEFRDLVGVNQQSLSGTFRGDLWQDTFAHTRNGRNLEWNRVEPSDGNFKNSLVQEFANNVLVPHKQKEVDVLPVFGYSTNWAADDSEYSFRFQAIDYTVSKDSNGRIDIDGYANDGRHVVDFNNISPNSTKLPFKTQYIDDWKDYVSTIATDYHDNYGQEYFQVWNEAHPRSSFYYGEMNFDRNATDGFFERVQEPASAAIHEAGGKVVYGGWPAGPFGDITQYATYIDRHDGWDDVDVLDMHYRTLGSMDLLRQSAGNEGHPDVAVWNTEIGDLNNADPGYLANYYPRFTRWALEHNDGDPDRYRAYIYAYSGADGRIALFQGSANDFELTRSGVAMRTMGDVLGGGELEIYDAVTNSKNFDHRISESQNSLESFKVGDDRIVVALHLRDGVSDASITLEFSELDLADIDSAKRVTPFGDQTDLMQALEEINGRGVALDASTEVLLPDGTNLKNQSSRPRTFFVELGLTPTEVPEPASAALLLGVGGWFATRRPR